MRYLIAGNGPAAVHAVEAIRARDEAGRITMISPEGSRPYSRITVPEYLTGEVELEDIYFRPEDFYARNAIELVAGKRLASLDVTGRTAILEDGSAIPYDRLLLATGSRPAVPGWADLSLPGVHVLWGKADAERLAGKLSPEELVVIIGGGLVGMQAARALNDYGLRVTVLEAADRLMPQQLDHAAAGMLRLAAEAAGVRVEAGVLVTEIRRESGKARGVILRSGERIDAEHILVCTGVRPNLDMLKDTGIDWERGVEVDAAMRTALPGVYAAGDIVKGPVYPGSGREVRAIWPNAVEQGAMAGVNMAGGNEAYEGSRALNSIQLFGLAVASAGMVSAEPGMREEILSYPSSGNYQKLVLDGEILMGVLLAGDIRAAGPLFAKLGRPLGGFLSGLRAVDGSVCVRG